MTDSLPRKRFVDPVDLAPFVAWCNAREQQLTELMRSGAPGAPTDPTNELLRQLGWADDAGTRRLYRYRGGEQVSGQAERQVLEDALHHAGVAWWEIYPDDEPAPLGDEAWCPRCRENVSTVDDGRCAWCDARTEAPDFEARPEYCQTCDRTGKPMNGKCRRCGQPTNDAASPWDPCQCGCGQLVRRFDLKGRRSRWVRGHAPRSLERPGEVPVEPFAAYLEQCLRDVDPVDAVAIKHGMGRDEVLSILRREDPIILRRKVHGALFKAARRGVGGPNRRHGEHRVTVETLYPKSQCPGPTDTEPCLGTGRKAPHAERCKPCSALWQRRQKPGYQSRKDIGWQAPAGFIEEAWTTYQRQGSLLRTAEALLDRTPFASAQSLAHRLRAEFNDRGWDTSRRRQAAAA